MLNECQNPYPVLTVTGPRQSGKTTVCRMGFPRKECVVGFFASIRSAVSLGTCTAS
ncbi:MAG: hypothetical protein OXK80_00015 [Bdellovibrionales bacterium]|nr:hypothetical protein [Bdellovibrionales bacterium]